MRGSLGLWAERLLRSRGFITAAGLGAIRDKVQWWRCGVLTALNKLPSFSRRGGSRSETGWFPNQSAILRTASSAQTVSPFASSGYSSCERRRVLGCCSGLEGCLEWHSGGLRSVATAQIRCGCGAELADPGGGGHGGPPSSSLASDGLGLWSLEGQPLFESERGSPQSRGPVCPFPMWISVIEGKRGRCPSMGNKHSIRQDR